MLKNILKLNGTQELSKNEQQNIAGGFGPIGLGEGRCPSGPGCVIGYFNGEAICGPCHL